MPGKLYDEEDKAEIESQAKESQKKKGLSARLEAASNKGKMDDETMRRAWDAKKGGGSEGGAERSAGSTQPKDTREEEETIKKKREQEAADKEKKEDKRVADERRNHELDRYYRERYEKSR